MLRCRTCTATLVFFCSADVILTKSCAAASEKLQCNIEKAALQESGAFLPLSCGVQAPTFRHPRLDLLSASDLQGSAPKTAITPANYRTENPPPTQRKINSVPAGGIVKTSGFTRGVCKKSGSLLNTMDFLENRRSSENQKPPENRQKSGLFQASPFTMHLVCTLLRKIGEKLAQKKTVCFCQSKKISSRFLGRGCNEALFSEQKRALPTPVDYLSFLYVHALRSPQLRRPHVHKLCSFLNPVVRAPRVRRLASSQWNEKKRAFQWKGLRQCSEWGVW